MIKVLPPETATQLSLERFKREILLAARPQHPHIVPLHSSGESNALPSFTMPFVEGESLRVRLARHGDRPVNDAIRVLREIASALAYAHERGIVHRDIKPDNVLLSGGSAMVTDFGVAKALSASSTSDGSGVTSLGVAIGTPAYMAPEQASADPAVDHRADIYAFGMLADELLTGQPPFVGRTPQNLLAAHVTESPEAIGKRRASLPPALAALVMRCLEKRPADRPQSAVDVVHALDDITTPSGGTAPHSTMSKRTTSHGTTPHTAVPMGAAGGARRWRAALAAAVVLVASISAFAVWRANRGLEVDARRVAVVPFVNLTGDSALSVVGRVAAEELSRSISQTDSADVVASTAVEAALGAAGNAASDAVQRVARATRASIVVLGSYSKVGDSQRVQTSLVDARTGKVIRALDPTIGTVADPMTAIAALRERMLGSIVSGDVARQVVLGSVPPKYSAYLEFLAGTRMFMKDQRAARPFYERAIALDSTFVMPYGALAATCTNAGLFDEADHVVDKLEAQRQRLSSYDRLQLEAVRANSQNVADEILPLEQQRYARGGDPLYAYLTSYWALRVLKPVVALKALQLSHSMMTASG